MNEFLAWFGKLGWILTVSLFTLVACSQAPDKIRASSASASSPKMEAGLAGPVGSEGQTPPAFGANDAKTLKTDPSAAFPRKRVMTGDLQIEVDNLAKQLGLIAAAAEKMGGYVAANTLTENGASLTLRVPAGQFQALMNLASSSGKLVSSQSRSDDVSDSWYDLEARLKAKRILLDRYLGYLRQAKNIEELMAIERQVNDTTSEIEGLEASFRNLDSLVQYSTINISLYLPGKPDNSGFDFGGAMAKLGRDLLNFLQGLLVGLLYFILFGVPIIGMLLVAYWLLFGRIGWLRKLVIQLSPPPNTPPESGQGASK